MDIGVFDRLVEAMIDRLQELIERVEEAKEAPEDFDKDWNKCEILIDTIIGKMFVRSNYSKYVEEMLASLEEKAEEEEIQK